MKVYMIVFSRIIKANDCKNKWTYMLFSLFVLYCHISSKVFSFFLSESLFYWLYVPQTLVYQENFSTQKLVFPFYLTSGSSHVLLVGIWPVSTWRIACDVTLMPGDTDDAFPVHRVMMASASDYFKAMFR